MCYGNSILFTLSLSERFGGSACCFGESFWEFEARNHGQTKGLNKKMCWFLSVSSLSPLNLIWPQAEHVHFFSPPRGHWKFTKVANCSDTGSQLESGNLIGKAPSTWWPPRMIPPVPFWWENLNPPMRLVRMTWFLSVSWCEKLSFDKWPVFFSRYENYPILDEFPSQPTTPDFFYCHVWVLLHPGRWTAGTHKSPGIQTSE